jgi:3-dehydroquinate synthase
MNEGFTSPSSAPVAACLPARVRIGLGERSYDIVIGRDVASNVAVWPVLPAGDRAVVVTNATVMPLHGWRLVSTLERSGRNTRVVELPDGEVHKTWRSVDTIVSRMLEASCDRRTIVFALGGGVVGDVAGFAAACYMRGVPCVQVPTTLLAQVDSSVGGKTAINHPLGKNMIGAFHQPVAVLCDLTTLDTLPDREYRAGLAEVVKYGPIADAGFVDWLERHADDLLAREPAALAHAVRRSCEIKADVVSRDEREADVRAILNFGHTFGHAIESQTAYAWLHGEAIGAGMILALETSAALGLVAPSYVQRIRRLLVRMGVPVTAPSMPWSAWEGWMRVDKKAEGGAIRYVLIDRPGHAVVRPVDAAVVRGVIDAHAARAA